MSDEQKYIVIWLRERIAILIPHEEKGLTIEFDRLNVESPFARSRWSYVSLMQLSGIRLWEEKYRGLSWQEILDSYSKNLFL